MRKLAEIYPTVYGPEDVASAMSVSTLYKWQRRTIILPELIFCIAPGEFISRVTDIDP